MLLLPPVEECAHVGERPEMAELAGLMTERVCTTPSATSSVITNILRWTISFVTRGRGARLILQRRTTDDNRVPPVTRVDRGSMGRVENGTQVSS